MGVNASCPCHNPQDDRVFSAGPLAIEYERVNGTPVVNFGSLMMVRSVYLAVVSCVEKRHKETICPEDLAVVNIERALNKLFGRYGKRPLGCIQVSSELIRNTNYTAPQIFLTASGALVLLEYLQRETSVGISKMVREPLQKILNAQVAEPLPTIEVPKTVADALLAEFRLHVGGNVVSLHRVRGGRLDPATKPERAAVFVQEKDAELLRELVEAGLRMYGISGSSSTKGGDAKFWTLEKLVEDLDINSLVPACMTRVVVPVTSCSSR